VSRTYERTEATRNLLAELLERTKHKLEQRGLHASKVQINVIRKLAPVPRTATWTKSALSEEVVSLGVAFGTVRPNAFSNGASGRTNKNAWPLTKWIRRFAMLLKIGRRPFATFNIRGDAIRPASFLFVHFAKGFSYALCLARQIRR